VRRARRDRSRRGDCVLRRAGHRPCRHRPGSTAGGRLVRQSAGRRAGGIRPLAGGGAAGRVERLHQRPVRAGGRPHRRLCPHRIAGGRPRRARPLCSALCAQGRWAGGGQGRGDRRNARRGRSRAGRHVRRRVWPRSAWGGCGSGDRGIHARRGSELLRADRWHDHHPFRFGAGSQAGGRRRYRPQHRRHGRIFPRPGAHAGIAGPRDGRDH